MNAGANAFIIGAIIAGGDKPVSVALISYNFHDFIPGGGVKLIFLAYQCH